jgi:monoamine oxidase
VRVELAGGRSVFARHAICTIPFAALRAIPMSFAAPSPVAPAIAELPYTRASFAYLSATEPFWRSDGMPETLWTDDPLLGRVFVLGDSPPMLKVWLTGRNADLLDRLGEAAAGAEIIRRYEEARPSARGKLRLLRLFSWQKSPLARGIYHHIAPAQGTMLAAAVRAEGARLHFAGEHLAMSTSGMEGALESGERTARLVAKRL